MHRACWLVQAIHRVTSFPLSVFEAEIEEASSLPQMKLKALLDDLEQVPLLKHQIYPFILRKSSVRFQVEKRKDKTAVQLGSK